MSDYVPEYDEKGRELAGDGASRGPITGRAGTFDSFTQSQRNKISAVYTMIAQALPVEGRDYSVSFSFPDPNGNPSVSLSASTQIGAAFVRHLSTFLNKHRR